MKNATFQALRIISKTKIWMQAYTNLVSNIDLVIHATMLLNKVINTSNIDPNNLVKQLYNFCIKSKYIKIVKYKKITLITQKFQEIYADFCGLYNSLLLLKKTYIDLFLNKFTC